MKTEQKEVTVQGVETSKATKGKEKTQTLQVVRTSDEALKLAKTIKAITDLARLIKHRDTLEQYRDKLSEFEFKSKDAAFEDKNEYIRCSLKITDENNRLFEIKSPTVIKAVVDFMHRQFDLRLTETEAQIKLP